MYLHTYQFILIHTNLYTSSVTEIVKFHYSKFRNYLQNHFIPRFKINNLFPKQETLAGSSSDNGPVTLLIEVKTKLY